MSDLLPISAVHDTVMDRLSDWLGSLVPGCARLPARHPVKVSLVMGPLGIAAGAMIFVFWSGFGRETFLSNGNVYWGLPTDAMLVSSAVSGVMILVPLLMWNKNSLWLCVVSIAVASVSRYASEGIHWFSFESLDVARYLYTGLEDLIIAIIHAVWIAVVIRRKVVGTLGLSIVSSILFGPVWLWLYDLTWGSRPAPILLLYLMDQVAFAAPWLAFYSTLAVCLGISIWDATPLPKFEPVEPI